jgi:hypothetical protein
VVVLAKRKSLVRISDGSFFFINGYALIKDNKVESFPLLFVFQLRRGDSIVIELNSLVTNGGFIETKSFIEHRKRIFFPLFIQIH